MMQKPNAGSLGLYRRILAFSLLLLSRPGRALNLDGVLLLSFKYAILSDPLSVLDSWNYDDATPCSWNGVTCAQIGEPGKPNVFRVTGLVLPKSKLLGSIPPELGQIEHLTNLDLSNNLFNGSLPDTIFNSSSLQVLSLSKNAISGELKGAIGGLKSLKLLNLSDNALAGNVPGGFSSVEVLDLSSNLLNGSLPQYFGGSELRYLNLSYNKISGSIPADFGSHIPKNATIDLSFNNLSGAVPDSIALLDQKTEFLAGNSDLCGKPLKILCSVPPTLSSPDNSSSTSPAIAVVPKPTDSGSGVPMGSPATASGPNHQTGNRLKPGTIAGIVLGDLAGIGIIALVILYVYQLRKRKALVASDKKLNNLEKRSVSEVVVISQDPESKKPGTLTWSCLRMKAEEASEATSTSDSDHEEDKDIAINNQAKETETTGQKGGSLVTVDGETKLELDALLKASAYILGTSRGSIVYKAVLENGTAYAVRRIGESGVKRFKDFEGHVRATAKLKHQNLVRVRGFYWGDKNEKLVIYDYVPNGSLSIIGYRKGASSPFHLTFETRLKIARGVARGLAYIHEKKQVHGNVKPSNILLGPSMEPVISDLGLDRLITGNQNRKLGTMRSARQLGSQRFHTPTREGQHESPSPYTAIDSATSSSVSPYHAPESLKNVKPNPKWDVYSYGIVLLELLTGRVFTDLELSQWAATVTSSAPEDRNRSLRIMDASLRADVAAREEAVVACLKLGFSCASMVPQGRPCMKEAVQVLEKIP